MKRSIIIRRSLLIALCAGLLINANAQRGFRGNYGHGYRVYRPVYSYRPPIIVGRYAAPVVFGPRYYAVPHGSLSIMFGGNPYFFFGGSFYIPFGRYYRTVMPPVGIHITMLPYGYVPIMVGPDQYYFYNGIYYRHFDDRSYEVVDAPMGAQLSSLPKGAKSVLVNGEKFYELNGTYYKEDRDSKGRVVYTVVGKDGQINNSEETPAQPSAPKLGDKIFQLPQNSKSIMLNGEKLYVSPDNIYYRQEADGSYTVVGLPTSA